MSSTSPLFGGVNIPVGDDQFAQVVLPGSYGSRPQFARLPIDRPLARLRAYMARARSGGQATYVVFLGDSLTEGYEASKRGLRWANLISYRLNGSKPTQAQYIPITTNAFSTRAATDWPGDQSPWTYSGTITGLVSHGADLHAASLASGAWAQVNYFGDVISLAYTRTTDGPTAAQVLVDGVAQPPLNANGSELPGQLAAYGTIGDYGAHTLRVTASGAPMVVEGVVVNDGVRFGFGLPFDCVGVVALGHAGFSAQQFAAASNWPQSLATIGGGASTGAVVIAFGANDAFGGRAPVDFRSDLLTIVAKIDEAYVTAGVTDVPPILFLMMLGLSDTYINAARDAAETLNPARAGVLDLRDYTSGDQLPASMLSGGHPDNGGQQWLATIISHALEGSKGPPTGQPASTEHVILAATPPVSRSNWPENIATVGVIGHPADTSPTGTTQGERRHRIWLESGTYRCRLTYAGTAATAGTAQVLIGHTSLGTQVISGGATDLTSSLLGSSAVIDSPGWYPLTIRKTTADGVVPFVQAHVIKTA